jgi:hypothetical protein
MDEAAAAVYDPLPSQPIHRHSRWHSLPWLELTPDCVPLMELLTL